MNKKHTYNKRYYEKIKTDPIKWNKFKERARKNVKKYYNTHKKEINAKKQAINRLRRKLNNGKRRLINGKFLIQKNICDAIVKESEKFLYGGR